MKKNDIITLKITDMTSEGNGVGHIFAEGSPDNGMAVFVPAAAVGDVILCRIVKVLKSMCYGIVEKLIEPSPYREDRGCLIRKSCGGCVFRHISYKSELEIKENMVKNAFLRLGKFEDNGIFLPILGCESTDRYRNKAQYPVCADKDGRAIYGFYASHSHRIIPCEDCLLQPDIFGKIVAETMEYINRNKIPPYDEKTGKGLVRHIYLRQGYHSGEIMLCLVVTKAEKGLFRPFAEAITAHYPEIKTVVLNINGKNTNVIMGERCIVLKGNGEITDIMCGNKITLSPLSFYQVNTVQAERLYGRAIEFAALTGKEDVLDLYCGAGTIGLSMAGQAAHITGAEIIPAAVENAKKNAAQNGISNIDFICADAGEAARVLCESGRKPDVIVTDPPRKGCDTLTLDSMITMSPSRIVMVSCNPATAARDCRYLADHGYNAEKVQAVDLFPGTGHVECVVLMTRIE